MLKRFSVENFSSIRDEQTLDMTSGSTKVLGDHVVQFTGVGVLKSAVIYGANASGKSNFVRAIDFARKAILNGLADLDTYKKHFRLCNKSHNKNTSFEFEIELNGQFYSYGFSSLLKDKKITEEWLYEIGGKKSSRIFERAGAVIQLGEDILNSDAKDRFKIYSDDMVNQGKELFLKEIAGKRLNIEVASIFNAVYRWFVEKLIVVYPDDKFFGMNTLSKDLTQLLSEYLARFDTGVVSINTINEDFEKSLKDLPEEIKVQIERDLGRSNVKEIAIQGVGYNPQFLTVYKDSSGDLKVKKLGFIHSEEYQDAFELKDESDGTKRLLDFIPLISRFSSDSTIVIDEFDRSLHPMLTKEFFKIFQSSGKLSHSQLIVTTHESTLLDLNTIRRDEIWFVEKDKFGSSSIYSLNKFQVRYDSRVEKAYLLGRYGAIPVFDSFECMRGEDGV